jgi:N-acetyl-anhydromuramoyl-L-alanine amidase
MSPPESRSGLWQEGWYRFARPLRSPNFGPRPDGASIDLLVVHSISLPPGEYGGTQVQQLFTNQLDPHGHPWFERLRGLQVSAHFYIQRHGELWQFVSCDQRAWHAGLSRFQGRDNCNDFSVGIELEGLEGEAFEPAQYETLASLCAGVAQQYPVTHVAGHEHVAPGRKQDPGAGFDWPLLQRTLAWSPQCFPSGVLLRPGR